MKKLVAHKTDGKRFGFLNAKDRTQIEILEEINFILQLPSDGKPYMFNYKDVDEKYLLHGVGDIDEFSRSYTFGWAILNGFINDRIVKQAVYEEIRNYLWSQSANLKNDTIKLLSLSANLGNSRSMVNHSKSTKHSKSST